MTEETLDKWRVEEEEQIGLWLNALRGEREEEERWEERQKMAE